MVKFIYEIYGGNFNMNKKKLCCFYVNDIHLITMLLPYINERINEGTEVITMMETDMSNEAKKVIEEIQGKKSRSLLEIDWKSKSLSYLYECDVKDKLILISGTEEFIKETNRIIANRDENCNILNCFEIMQGSEKLQEILDEHDKVINTSGEKNPQEVFEGYIKKDYSEITL